MLAFHLPVFGHVFQQGRDCVVDDSHDILEMFLAVRDVFVWAGAFGLVFLEELREDARVRVDHVNVGVPVVREGLSDDKKLCPVYGFLEPRIDRRYRPPFEVRCICLDQPAMTRRHMR